MKKFLALVLALACVLSLCACGKGKKGAEGDGLTADGRVKLSIGIPTNALVLDHDKNALTNWVEKECNVELTFVEYAGGTDVATQINTTVAARQELPDILFGISLGDKNITRYGKDGYLLDLTKYYDDKEGASKIFWDRMNNELTEVEREHVMNTIIDAETEKIYCVPCVETSLVDKMDTQAWINTEWLKKIGMDAPTNKDELLTVLRAFKNTDCNGNGEADEIPLFGVDGALGSKPINWLLNMFMYYDNSKPYNVKDGKVYATYTSNEYREALKYIRTLYKEGLMTSMAWTASASEMKQICTPIKGVAKAGILLTHLTTGATVGSEILYEYEPLVPFWNVIRHPTSCSKTTFITEDCQYPDKAFEVLMKLWSWDGSMRVRYGEYGVNWTEPDPGAKSDIGLDATYKLLNDPLGQQTTAKWAKISSTLNICAEGETAQISDETNPWLAKRSAMHAESYRLFNEREAQQDNSEHMPTLRYTVEENERLEQYRTNTGDRRSRARTEFITGVMNIESDADWNKYLKEMDDLGEGILIKAIQVAYDRTVK